MGAMFFVVVPDRSELDHLATLVDTGALRPVISESFPLAEGRLAYASGSAPHRPGKTVLDVRVDGSVNGRDTVPVCRQ
jgi:NADPH:quinone reductase-like Zn-dependent oxidoreductase